MHARIGMKMEKASWIWHEDGGCRCIGFLGGSRCFKTLTFFSAPPTFRLLDGSQDFPVPELLATYSSLDNFETHSPDLQVPKAVAEVRPASLSLWMAQPLGDLRQG